MSLESQRQQFDPDISEEARVMVLAEDDQALREAGITFAGLDVFRECNLMYELPEEVTDEDVYTSVNLKGQYYIDGADGISSTLATTVNFELPDLPGVSISGFHLVWDNAVRLEAMDGATVRYFASLSDSQSKVLKAIAERKKSLLPFVPQEVESSVVIPEPI
jgi:hypothetical protein